MNPVHAREEIIESMIVIANTLIEYAKLNATIEGFVSGVLGNNQYRVKINNIEYNVPGTEIPASSYKVGMIVCIEVPNQNFSQKYIKCQKPY